MPKKKKTIVITFTVNFSGPVDEEGVLENVSNGLYQYIIDNGLVPDGDIGYTIGYKAETENCVIHVQISPVG